MRVAVALLCCLAAPAVAGELIYFQDFERPQGYVNDGGDLNIYRTVNQNYGDQPKGFRFAQQYTVETLNVSGSHRGARSAAFGDGWRDPSGWGGNFAIGMLSDFQDDRLGLVFNLWGRRYLNLTVDISSIDVSEWAGPHVAEGGEVPVFAFTLYASGSASPATHSGQQLDQQTVTGTASPPETFDWTAHKVSLDGAGAAGGWVILQIDLLEGGYAAFDNLRIMAADSPDDFGRPQKRPMR
jgi:hypothetical protein